MKFFSNLFCSQLMRPRSLLDPYKNTPRHASRSDRDHNITDRSLAGDGSHNDPATILTLGRPRLLTFVDPVQSLSCFAPNPGILGIQEGCYSWPGPWIA